MKISKIILMKWKTIIIMTNVYENDIMVKWK